MGGGAPVPACCALGHTVQPAARSGRGLCPRPLAISGARGSQRGGAPAPDHAAGGDRLSVVARLRHAGAHRRVYGQHAGVYLRLSMDGGCAGGGRHGVSLYGARRAPLDRGGRPETGTGGGHARGVAGLGFPDCDAAADPARHHRRNGADLRQGHGRIRGDDHLRVKHSGPDPDHPAGDRPVAGNPGGRDAGGAAGGAVDPDGRGGFGLLRMDGAARCGPGGRALMLEVRLTHTLGALRLDVAFEAPKGVTVLFGRSGSGKTTIVNAVAGLLRPASGRIAIGERVLCDTAQRLHLPPHRRRLGYIFQEGRLFPHLGVRQNLRYGQWFAPRGARAEDMARVVEMLGIGDLLGRRPGALSGGEKQRVAIGRALLSAPRAILADEPLASLDEARKAEILPYLERLRDEVDIPILYVSHSASEVARLATTVVALDQGRVVAQGRAEAVLGNPAITPLGAREAGAVLVARGRPDGLSALNVLPGVVQAVREGAGPGAIVAVDTQAGRVLARITRRAATALSLAPGAEVHVVVKAVSVAQADVGAAG